MACRSAAGACAWLLFALTVGCGKAEGGAKPIPETDFARRVATLLCDGLTGCCKSGGFPIDTEGCKAAYTAEFEVEFAHYRVLLGYDAQAAGDCLAQGSPIEHCGDLDSDAAPACRRIFVGTRAPGEPCNSSQECAPVTGRSVRCESDDGVSPHVCGVYSGDLSRRGVAGDTCGATCFEGETCDFASVSAPEPDTGDLPAPSPRAACYQDDGLYCDDAGRCAPLLASGAACSSSAACGSLTTFCNFDTGLCAPLQPDGSSCDSGDQCRSDKCADVPGVVADATGRIPRVCVPPTTVTAERCETASIYNEPAGSAPAGDPGTP